MRGARTFPIPLTATALCAVVLSGCGGGNDSATTTGSTAGNGSTTSEGAMRGARTEGATTAQGKGGLKGNADSSSGSSRGEAPRTEPPGSVERSDSLRTPGGDNSIQGFGDETIGAERAKATKTIEAIDRATATGKWSEVCEKYLAANVLEQLTAAGKAVPKFKGKGCAEVLASISPGTQGEVPSRIDGAVVSLRAKGETGYAMYHGTDGKGYAYPLMLEDGVWKATRLAPIPLSF